MVDSTEQRKIVCDIEERLKVSATFRALISQSGNDAAGCARDLARAAADAAMHIDEIAELRAHCNFKIKEINAWRGTETPGFRAINELLKKCDAVFSVADSVKGAT